MSLYEKLFGCAHDFEVLKSADINEFELILKSKLKDLKLKSHVNFYELRAFIPDYLFIDRICLKCSKHENEFTSELSRLIQECIEKDMRHKTRQKLAKKILKEKGIKI